MADMARKRIRKVARGGSGERQRAVQRSPPRSYPVYVNNTPNRLLAIKPSHYRLSVPGWVKKSNEGTLIDTTNRRI